jgi:hypothetical protein
LLWPVKALIDNFPLRQCGRTSEFAHFDNQSCSRAIFVTGNVKSPKCGASNLVASDRHPYPQVFDNAPLG